VGKQTPAGYLEILSHAKKRPARPSPDERTIRKREDPRKRKDSTRRNKKKGKPNEQVRREKEKKKFKPKIKPAKGDTSLTKADEKFGRENAGGRGQKRKQGRKGNKGKFHLDFFTRVKKKKEKMKSKNTNGKRKDSVRERKKEKTRSG